MTTTTAQLCQCGAPAALDAYLCDHCTGRLRAELRRLAPASARAGLTRWDTRPGFEGLGDDLDTQVARQARIGASDARGGEKPVPFHERAAQIRGTLRQHLHPWAVWIAGDHPARRAQLDRATVGELAEYLLDQVERIRITDGAAQLAHAVFDAVLAAERTIDLPPDLFALGQCGHELRDGTLCQVPLYARAAAGSTEPDPDDVVICTDRAGLTGCGTEWKVAERRAWLRGQAVDQVGTAATVATALARLGHPGLVGHRLRVWKDRGQIIDRAQPCPDHRVPLWVETGPRASCRACGPALYRVGDVMLLLERADAAAEARAAKRMVAHSRTA